MADGQDIVGFKGGGGEQRTPVEAPDSLYSTAIARVLDLLSEGDLEMWVSDDPLKDIFLDGTPVMNDDGSLNFDSVQVEWRPGSPDQEYIPGFPSVKSEIGIGVELLQATPWVRAVNNTDLSAVSIRLATPALTTTDIGSGDTKGGRIDYAIDLATDGGAYEEVFKSAFSGKTKSLYERSHRIDLPPATTGWQVRVRRISPNGASQYVQDKMTVQAIVEIIDAKLRYPYSAVVGISLDAQQFRSIPQRAYRVKGRIIQVPTNYSPTTRTYTGVWDGTFKMAWTNNPAWIYYDLATNDRYGLGRRVDPSRVDKWTLYKIAQYCDELVPDGKGGQEPRFTCTVYLQRAADAHKVMQDLASVFRGISYWAGGAVRAIADQPEDPVYTYTNANVKDGKFTYNGTGKKARHTVAMVAWSNLDNFGKGEVTPVVDEEGVVRYGLQPTQVTAFGATSESQAQRVGRWILASELLETDAASWAVGLDGTLVAPGKLVYVLDRDRAGRRLGGRISSVAANSVVVDALPEVAPVAGDTLITITPQGTAQESVVSAVDVLARRITVASPFPVAPLVQSVWGLQTATIYPQIYRILGVTDNGDKTFGIAALQHEPGKFAQVEQGVKVEPKPTSILPSTVVKAPTAVVLTSLERAGEVLAQTVVNADWEAVPNAAHYFIQWKRDDGEWTPPQKLVGTNADLENTFPGDHWARVWSMSQAGIASPYVISNKLTVLDQSLKPGFVDALNTQIATALETAQNAEAAADGAIVSFWQASPPVVGSLEGQAKEGDLWFDTDDGNKVHRVVSGAWAVAADDDMAQAIAAATTAQATADGKVKTWFGAAAPGAPDVTATKGIGDLWFNTTTKKLHRWNGADWNLEISDVTLDQIGGSGVNIMPEQYTRFINADLPAFHSSTSSLDLVADGESLGGYYLRNTIQTADPAQNWSYFAPNGANKNVFMEPGDYLLSYYAKANVSGHQIRVTTAFDVGGTAGTADQALTTGRVRYTHKITVPAGSVKSNLLVYWNRSGVAGRTVSIDGLMIEPMVGRLVQASKWAPGSTAQLSYDAIAAASAAQDAADGKIQSFFQPTMPTGTIGDLWFDTDDGNKQYRHNGTTFVVTQDTAIGDAILAAAGAQATADGKVTTFYKATEPTNADAPDPPGSLQLGDLWYNATTKELSRFNGTAWIKIADVTSAFIGGNGTNILWAEYAQQQGPAGAKDANTNPGFNTSGVSVDVVTDSFAPSGYSLRVTTSSTLASSYVRLNNINASNLVIGGNRKYLLSFYYKSNVSGHQIKPFIRGDLTQDFNPISAGVASGAYTRFTYVVNSEGIADGMINLGFFVNPNSNTVGRLIYIDRIMLEPMIGDKEEASPWSPGPSALQTAVAIANAAIAQATADGKIELFRQASPPATASEGDIWIDADDGKMYTWQSGSWIYDPNDEVGNAINAAQNTANARNTTFYTTTTPTALAVGDLWYNKNNMELRRWSGASWDLTTGAPTGGNGENLLPNANFINNSVGTVHNAVLAADEAAGDGWNVWQTSARADTDIRWWQTGQIRLRCYGTVAVPNGSSIVIGVRAMRTIPVEEGRTYKFKMVNESASFNGTIPSGVNIRSRMTVRGYDSAGAQVNYTEVVQGSRTTGTYEGTWTPAIGSGVKYVTVYVEGLVQNVSGASWTHNSSVAFDVKVGSVSMVKVASLDTEVQDGTDYGRYAVDDGYTYLGKRRFGLRIPGSGHRIGDQRNLPQSNTTAYGSTRTATALSATSAGAVSINAHTVRYGGVSVAYSAVSNAITGLTQGTTYVIYCFDEAYAGGVRTWLAGTDPAAVMNLGDGVVVAGQIKIPTSGSSSGGGSGTGGPEDWCVDWDSVLPDGRLVRDLIPGDRVMCYDMATGQVEWHEVRSIGFGEELCYRLVTPELCSIIQSASTPMDLPGGGVEHTPGMFGKAVVALPKGTVKSTHVADLEKLGIRRVVKVDLGNRMFFAGERADATLATHNAIHKP